MKKILSLSILIGCMGVCSLYAQIEVFKDGTVNFGDPINPQMTVDPNGRVIFGQKAVVFDEKDGIMVEVPSIVVASNISGFEAVGFQFPSFIPKMGMVPALTGLSNKKSSIGTYMNYMHEVYTEYLFISGPLGPVKTSDARLKDNIRELTSTIDRISRLRPVIYNFVADVTGESVSANSVYQNRTGFIAQEVQRIFPDLVTTIGEEEMLGIDYAGLIPYLTKAIQEQARTIESLQRQINEIQQGHLGNFDIDMPNRSPQQASQTENSVAHILHQNVPNPFNNATTITFHLAEGVSNAKICIYNLTGKQLQCYNLPTTQGENSIEVRALSLQPGMYLYSLIVDGRLIDTKRMILTE
jgi:hypothetical protein